MNEILRMEYLNQIREYKDKHRIKVITGIRRSGKSTLLSQFKDVLKNEFKINSSQIIDYDFNNKELAELTWKELLHQIEDKSVNNKINYVFLDEIQEIKDFEKCVITLFESKKFKYDLYITGSNSNMFSSNIATVFTGRSREIKLFPFSFKEYFQYVAKQLNWKDREMAFEKYVRFGGLPIIFEDLENEKVTKETLIDVRNDTLNKDIKKRHKIRNYNEFDKIVPYLFDHIGQRLEITNIVNFIHTNNNQNLSRKTINRFILWLEEAVLIYRAYFFSTTSKRTLLTAGKIYASDTGIRNTFSQFKNVNFGSLLENIVFIELKHRGYDVSIGKMYDGKEIDFVASKDNERMYIQVTNSLGTHQIQEREINNLLSIKDNREKIILVKNSDSYINENGIKIINLVDWLLNRNDI